MVRKNICRCEDTLAWNYHYATCMKCRKSIPTNSVTAKWKADAFGYDTNGDNKNGY